MHPCYSHGCSGWRLTEGGATGGGRSRQGKKSAHCKYAKVHRYAEMQRPPTNRPTARPSLPQSPAAPLPRRSRPPSLAPPQSPWPAGARTSKGGGGTKREKPKTWEEKSEAGAWRRRTNERRRRPQREKRTRGVRAARRGKGRAGGAAGQGVCGRRGRDGRAVGRGGGGRRRGQAQEDVAIFVSVRKRP